MFRYYNLEALIIIYMYFFFWKPIFRKAVKPLKVRFLNIMGSLLDFKFLKSIASFFSFQGLFPVAFPFPF